MRLTGIAVLAAASVAFIPCARAQSSGPSAQQIIQALKPTGQVSTTTRGIVPLAPGPSGQAAPSSAVKPTAAHVNATAKSIVNSRGGTPSINLNIDFALGSAQLTPQAKTELDRLGKALTDPSLATYHFKLVGHTDTTGSATTNLALSDARAKAVSGYLQSKFGIAPARLAASGVGEKDLLVPTGPNVANHENRRVQVINTGA
ncbi:MAG TPA: OmpA family protein [Acidiphilium sp.]